MVEDQGLNNDLVFSPVIGVSRDSSEPRQRFISGSKGGGIPSVVSEEKDLGPSRDPNKTFLTNRDGVSYLLLRAQ